MAHPKPLRNKLGVSQDAFATLIHCKAGVVAMAENGSRRISGKSAELLSAVEQASWEASNNPVPILLSNDALNKLMNRTIRKKEASKKLLLLKQEKLNEQMEQVQHFQQTANRLESKVSFVQDNTVGLQMKLLKRKAKIKQQALQLALAKLSIDLDSLEAAIAKAKVLKE